MAKQSFLYQPWKKIPCIRKCISHVVKSLILGSISVLVLALTLLGCSGPSELLVKPPVKYEGYKTLKNDCPLLLSNQQTASVSGQLNIRDSTVCITDRDGKSCKILLGGGEYGLDIWMRTGGANGMEELPDPYFTLDLVVLADDGDMLTCYEMVTTTLEPFMQTENGTKVCSFRVLSILRTKIVAAENQPGEGTVNLKIPANVRWYNTGIYVNKRQQLIILGGGSLYNLKGGNSNWDAFADMLGVTDGISGMICDKNCVINGENYGMLVAKINGGEPYLVTIKSNDFIVPTNGTLYLTVNDCIDCYEDNSGTFDVLIQLYNTP